MKLDVDGNYKMAASPAFFDHKTPYQIYLLNSSFVNFSPRGF